MVAAGNIPPRCARCCTDVHSTKESSRAAYRSVASGLHSDQKVGFFPLRMSPLTGWCMHTAVKGKCPSVSAQSGFGPE